MSCLWHAQYFLGLQVSVATSRLNLYLCYAKHIFSISHMSREQFKYKKFEEIRKLTTVQGEDYATGCLLQYEYIKNHYRLNSSWFK